ncbi:hypothetical protein Y032_0095g2845 [Ancylostoma ceylanicum]|uniref:ABC transmembrane type-1 domain-containing protein n=1 Tax=Ancylostoma ceylanicum TaxID=53326 RepID=A0A016TKT8_9BILA|nr:hypothetical protein Y032_0095g2845 [Ancylostoma ceylanicum]
MTANNEPAKPESQEEAESQKSVVYPIEDLYVDDPKKNTKAYEVTPDKASEKAISIDSDAKDSKKQEKSGLSSYKDLYAFSDRTDVKLMAVGLTCALLQAGIPPFVWLVMGNFVSLSITREEERVFNSSTSTNASTVDDQFAASATPAFIAMLSLSVSMFIAAFIQWFEKTMDEEMVLQNKISNLVNETFSCIRTVISFAAQKQTINKY